MPETDSDSTHLIAEKIRENVSRAQFDNLRGHHFQCTISIGIVHFPEDAKVMDDLMKAVDIALYRAKKMGKNYIGVDSNEKYVQIAERRLREIEKEMESSLFRNQKRVKNFQLEFQVV